MAERIGKRGADGGIDGIMPVIVVENGKVKEKTAIVQVKVVQSLLIVFVH